MSATTWFRVDPELGRGVATGDIVWSLAISSILAVLLGGAIQLGWLLFVGFGLDSIFVLIQDFVAALWWGFLATFAGTFLARAGLDHGVFGYGWSACLGAALVVIFTALMLVLSEGRSIGPETLWPAAHFGMLYGTIAGTIFWIILVARHPVLSPTPVRGRVPVKLLAVGITVVVVVGWSWFFWIVVVRRMME